MKAEVLPSGVCLVTDQVSGWVILAVGVGVFEPPAPLALIAPLSDGARSSNVSGPPLPPKVAVSS